MRDMDGDGDDEYVCLQQGTGKIIWATDSSEFSDKSSYQMEYNCLKL